MLKTYLVLLHDSLYVVCKQFLELRQEDEHHRQPIENQQEAFRQRGHIYTQQEGLQVIQFTQVLHLDSYTHFTCFFSFYVHNHSLSKSHRLVFQDTNGRAWMN